MAADKKGSLDFPSLHHAHSLEFTFDSFDFDTKYFRRFPLFFIIVS
jgi:hypothetical protein